MARRTLALLIVLVLIVPLAACGGSPVQVATPVNSTLSNGSTAPTAAPAVGGAATGGAAAATVGSLSVAPTAVAAAALAEKESPASSGAARQATSAEAPVAADAAPLPSSAEMGAGGALSAPAATAPAVAAEAMGAAAPAPDAAAPAPDAAAPATGGVAPTSGGAAPSHPSAPEASLKAGERNDNAAFADYLTYLQGYQQTDVRLANVSERYLISVSDDNQRPLLDARVTVYDGDRAIFHGRTYAGGKTIFMPRLFDTGNSSTFRVVAEYGQARAETTFTRGQTEQVELGLRGVQADKTLRLDLLFLLDTTGSMGDELSRIQQTIDSIAARIDGFTPRPEIRYSLVAYRDAGDEYLNRPFDFTSDLAAFRKELGALNANGGGDTQEALDEALYQGVVRASWRDAPAVRLVFLVGDAGPHVTGSPQFTYLDGTREAVARGVKIYPIAASNTDPQAEYVFRQLAQQTMGGFVFLTYQTGANSGAPGESTTLEAGAAPYTVERLDDLIVNIVERELAAAVGAR